jgi:membrane protein involved in colicin uptake
VEKVAAEKRRLAEEVERESAARARRLAEENAAEQKRKEDLIRQLRVSEAGKGAGSMGSGYARWHG